MSELWTDLEAADRIQDSTADKDRPFVRRVRVPALLVVTEERCFMPDGPRCGSAAGSDTGGVTTDDQRRGRLR